ncbi:hypothetical protein [Infirmifilum sp. NZ]|uniref:hypothetical protein n=1 Tax=Infirmifilum sp. NZ TaxID=2926850 RepID=UPI0027A7106B|nr:hypothetical protein [Infirmifilum sp. NZ]UNQ72878.1 hypothetical protein MOV14_07140 [Infirmifilum sp. NZ]
MIRSIVALIVSILLLSTTIVTSLERQEGRSEEVSTATQIRTLSSNTTTVPSQPSGNITRHTQATAGTVSMLFASLVLALGTLYVVASALRVRVAHGFLEREASKVKLSKATSSASLFFALLSAALAAVNANLSLLVFSSVLAAVSAHMYIKGKRTEKVLMRLLAS